MEYIAPGYLRNAKGLQSHTTKRPYHSGLLGLLLVLSFFRNNGFAKYYLLSRFLK